MALLGDALDRDIARLALPALGTLAVEPVVQVAGAEALLSERTGGACPTLSVRTAAGAMVPVTAAIR